MAGGVIGSVYSECSSRVRKGADMSLGAADNVSAPRKAGSTHATMAEVETTQEVEQRGGIWSRYSEITRDVKRGFVAEWTVTIILLLFATTTLIQAFVIPSASMEDTLLIGDHVLVDKLVYAPAGAV